MQKIAEKCHAPQVNQPYSKHSCGSQAEPTYIYSQKKTQLDYDYTITVAPAEVLDRKKRNPLLDENRTM